MRKEESGAGRGVANPARQLSVSESSMWVETLSQLASPLGIPQVQGSHRPYSGL